MLDNSYAHLPPILFSRVNPTPVRTLGIPTTRSLAVVSSGENVYRETPPPGAILTRIAASHIRVGTFDYIAMQNNEDLLKTMVTYVLTRHYPHLQEAGNPALELLNAVIEKQIRLKIGRAHV